MKTNKREQYAYLKHHPQNWDELCELIPSRIISIGYNVELNDIDISKIERLDYILLWSHFNGDLSKWDVGNILKMSEMFGSSDFNSDISNWDINPKCDTSDMFKDSPYTNIFNNRFYFRGNNIEYLKYFNKNS